MSNGTIVLDCQPSNDRRILHSNGEKPGEDSFHSGTFLKKFFKSFASIVDLFADAWGQTDRNIASFLGDKFGMSGGAKKIALPLLAEMNGAAIHEVSDPRPLMGGFSFPIHREIGLAVDIISFKGIRGCGFASGVARDDGLGFEIFDNETEDVFRIIDGVSAHGFDGEGESFFCFLEHGDRLMDFTDIGGMSNLPERDLLLSIGHNVISIAPEVADLSFERLGEMDQDS